MYKIKGYLVSSNQKEVVDVECPISPEELIEIKEPLSLKVKYNDNIYLALYDDLNKKVIVFDI